jgi:cytochrome c553
MMQIAVRHAAQLSVWAGLLALSVAVQAQTPSPAPNPHLTRNLAATCANCHGANGQALGEMKSLAGTPAERTIALMTYFKTTAQPEGITIMHQIAKGYTDDQIKLIAGYFASQPVKK